GGAGGARRGGRLLGRQRHLGARRPAPSRPPAGRPRRRLRLRAPAAGGGRRLQPGGSVLALRAVAARAGVAGGLDHGRQRLHLRAAAVGLRGGRRALRPRPRAPVPAGAARPPGRLRAVRGRPRAADADERDRVPAQGADVRALLADHAARLDAAAAATGVPGRDRLAPPAPLLERRPPPRPARHERRPRAAGLALPGRARRPGRGGDRGRRGPAARALLRARLLGDRAGARQLPAPRRARHLGAGGGHALNRALDVALAGAGLLVSAPLLGLAALAVKLEDGGPVLYRQTRVGKDGVDFELLKLRTMVVGAERLGAGFAVDRGDPRITRVGRLLRRTSVDELPQLWNVLRGDMSVIGPRPTLRYQVERYTARQRRRLSVKPGLTGWAQVHGRATLSWEERIELDLWYVEHRSPRIDLEILLRTPL